MATFKLPFSVKNIFAREAYDPTNNMEINGPWEHEPARHTSINSKDKNKGKPAAEDWIDDFIEAQERSNRRIRLFEENLPDLNNK